MATWCGTKEIRTGASNAARFRIGTSGWSYPQWRGHFYPAGLPSGGWLRHYAQSFDTVELNTIFYRLPTVAMLERWAALTPPGFLFAVKAPRLVTHELRLQGSEAALAEFLARVAALGERAGPVLFQLPPQLSADHDLLERFLAGLPQGHRCTVEFRHPSWWTERTLALLAARNVAFCLFDLAGLRPPRHVTADFTYLRLHGHIRRYRDPYPAAVLADWAAWLRAELGQGRDAYVYLDNTMERDHAVRDALALRDRVLGS